MHDNPISHRTYRAADGSENLILKNGNHFSIKRSGEIEGDLTRIASVGIRNLAEVASYNVTHIANSHSHVVRFIDGSLLQYAYTDSGQLLELTAYNLMCAISADNQMVFYMTAPQA